MTLLKQGCIYVLMTTSILFTGCHNHFASKSVGNNKICMYQLEYTIPDVMEDGRAFVLNEKVDAFEDSNYTLYRFPYVYTLDSDYVRVKEEMRNRVLVFEKREKTGNFYTDDSIGNQKIKVDVDSFLRQTVFNGVDFYNPVLLSLVKTNENANGVEQFFILKNKVSNSDCDSVVAYYNKQALGIDYSFSKRLDTNSQFKLYKLNVICPEYYSETYKFTVRRRVIVLELKKNEGVSASDEMYFYRYVRELGMGTSK